MKMTKIYTKTGDSASDLTTRQKESHISFFRNLTKYFPLNNFLIF